jgi:hypothetical protein
MLTPEAICQIIDSGTGFAVSFAVDLLSIYQLEDGQFAVVGEECAWEYLFDDPMEAARFFLKKREERKMGFDYETR